MENEAIEDYESVALSLEEELSEVYKEINQCTVNNGRDRDHHCVLIINPVYLL